MGMTLAVSNGAHAALKPAYTSIAAYALLIQVLFIQMHTFLGIMCQAAFFSQFHKFLVNSPFNVCGDIRHHLCAAF